jgi:hypothetical protein
MLKINHRLKSVPPKGRMQTETEGANLFANEKTR